ncbi:FAD binding domain-containing protein [Boeremia exigua]|uniref:FAD binding domain-containing protein n=1 Tax=Boeremia exigua TaxID=749465 RepID=UPI001E8CF147|nr:FAD binding domain-containing protein [Boeremia exigua]KAH6642273.1 FAD binding domain-containing protein [Boeremia exigua]
MPKTDVLIVGSGSAGIFAATWLAIYGIPFTILERRSGPLEVGQADGVQVRTVEIYDSFGLAEDLLREAYHIYEVCFWGTDEEGGIKRNSRSIDTEQGLSHLPHVILNQARMNGLMLGKMEKIMREKGSWNEGTANGIEYGWTVTGIDVDQDTVSELDAHCVRVSATKDSQVETWEAKYVLGCDGAHSTVRRSLNYRMLGDSTDTVWGVMDIYPLTDFPDIRRKCTIHSSSGNLLIIPREGGSLVRFYIQLPAGSQPKDVTLSDLQNTAKNIFAPYSMAFADTFWWSAYSIGQRLADNFHKDMRIFLTGDACHTHSPKAGQGMNVSLQDGYNLGWKLGSVLSRLSPPSILPSYVSERSKTAADLIAFDRELSRLFSRKEEKVGEFAEYFTKSGRYMAGFTARYEDSPISNMEQSKEEVATGINVGMRFPNAQVVRFCDARPVQLQSACKSDGRWRVVVFAGDVVQNPASKDKMERLASTLEETLKRFTPLGSHLDSVIEPLLILSTRFRDTEQLLIPDVFSPKTGKWGIKDLHKTYIDDEHYNAGHGQAYEKYGVDPEKGALVIVRPDQYVAKTLSLEDGAGVEEFFAGCLLEQNTQANGTGKH